MSRFHHILVPTDFGEPSREALEVAIDLALAFDAKLTLLHTWEVPVFAYGSLPYIPPDVCSAIEQAANNELEKTLGAARKRMPRAESILGQGVAAVEILACVERSQVDLIVMGTHGRHGVGRVFLGSVAEKVVRLSPVPVLTIHGKK